MAWPFALRVERVEVVAADGHTAVTFRTNSQAQHMAIILEGLGTGLYTVCAVSGNLVTGEVVYEEENAGLVQGWEDAIAVTLEGIYRYETGGYEQFLSA